MCCIVGRFWKWSSHANENITVRPMTQLLDSSEEVRKRESKFTRTWTCAEAESRRYAHLTVNCKVLLAWMVLRENAEWLLHEEDTRTYTLLSLLVVDTLPQRIRPTVPHHVKQNYWISRGPRQNVMCMRELVSLCLPSLLCFVLYEKSMILLL